MVDQKHLEWINALMTVEHWEDAITATEAALAEDPANHELLWNIGWAYFKLDQYAKAATYLRKSIDLGPVSHISYGALGVSLLKLQEYDGAELWLLRALALRDTYLTRISLAILYHQQGLTDAAENVHKEGVRLQPCHRERLEAYADFLSDVGREEEAQKLYEAAQQLPEREK